MALDPIVSLAVAIAEGPGSYAFFLGSGVSRDAGVPTGSEVYWRAVGELYRLQNKSEETPDEEALGAWLAAEEDSDLGYADVLERIAPDPASRRDYLAQHFEGIEPGPTHERLADLAERGLVTVFVTTNFDRLLENALRVRGLEPTVITSADDLETAQPREHATVYVLKPHGDYLQQTIRNTPQELAELEQGVAAELDEILARHGIVVLGYSGSDPAIADALRRRRSRYGLYWVSRKQSSEPARSLVEATGGRAVVRPGAEEFLADLDRRLHVYEVHPSGQTPLAVHDETIALLRRNDSVGLAQLLREEQREYSQALSALTAGREGELPTGETLLALHDQLIPVMERRLASLLPLLLHAHDAFTDQVNALVAAANRREQNDGYLAWLRMQNWCDWWLSYAAGAFALQERQAPALTQLLLARRLDPHSSYDEAFVQTVPGDIGIDIGKLYMQRLGGSVEYVMPAFEALRRELPDLDLLAERYPDLASEDGAVRALVEFDVILNIALSLRDERAISHWSMYGGRAERFARHVHLDPHLRGQLAEALGIPLDDFSTRAADALDKSVSLDPFPYRDAINFLRNGTRRP